MTNLCRYRFFICLTLVLLGGIPANAQTPKPITAPTPAGPVLKTYHGEYEGGQATYTYYLAEDGQRVRHGRFELVKKVSVFVDSRRTVVVPDQEHRTTGAYAHGQQTGIWTTTATRYTGFGGRAADIANRTTSTQTFVDGRLNGLITYADVPWKTGKPDLATSSASARRCTRPERQTIVVPRRGMFDSSVDDEHPLTEREKQGLDSEIDTVVVVTEYAAGPYRYDAAPNSSDPSHRPQTLRGRFDARGYCDSIWTLHYWKSGSEGRENMDGRTFTAVERVGGWMTTVLTFDHGALRRERTTQASTGAVISKFSLPVSQPYNAASRLVLLSSPAHLYEWQSPISKSEDASGYFFREATTMLGPPLLLDVSFQLAPTAADSAVLHQAETVLATAHAQWLGLRGSGTTARPATDTTGAAFRELYLQLYDLLAVRQVGAANNKSDDELEDNPLVFKEQGGSDNAAGRNATNPYPWLRALMGSPEEEGEPADADEADTTSEAALLAHLQKIKRGLAQVQARLSMAPSLAAPIESAATTP